MHLNGKPAVVPLQQTSPLQNRWFHVAVWVKGTPGGKERSIPTGQSLLSL